MPIPGILISNQEIKNPRNSHKKHDPISRKGMQESPKTLAKT